MMPLEKSIRQLINENAALRIQTRLLENFVEIARSPGNLNVLKTMMQKTLDVSTDLTGAEKGSLFLFDETGRVHDGLLAREEISFEKRLKIINSVMDKGLAGWVSTHRRHGLVTDTLNDERWIDLPDQPYMVRSALAVPISRGKNLFGILTLLHSSPGHFTPETAGLMQMTADQMALALENMTLYAKLKDSNRSLEKAKTAAENYSKALDKELDKGREIQKDFLPGHHPRIKGWEIAACFIPATQVSGDFYDVFALSGSHLALVIGDVCDKGVGSALFMAMFRSLIRIFSSQACTGSNPIDQLSPLEAISMTNRYIVENHGSMSMFATVFFGVLNTATGSLSYINAGHEPVFVFHSPRISDRLIPTGPALGLLPDAEFQKKSVMLDPGLTLLGYTDGVTEACSPDEEIFSKRRLQKIIEQSSCSASELVERVKNGVLDFTGSTPQHDDITMLSVRRLPSSCSV